MSICGSKVETNKLDTVKDWIVCFLLNVEEWFYRICVCSVLGHDRGYGALICSRCFKELNYMIKK